MKSFMRIIFMATGVVFSFLVRTLSAQTDSVTITEVMYNPSGSQSTDEFIEIHNFSKTRTYNINNWLVSDSTAGNDSDKVVTAGEGTLLYPGQFGVILDGDYFAGVRPYDAVIPDTARILRIGGTSVTFGNGGLTNASKTVMLIKSGGAPRDTISRFRYMGSAAAGRSEEKIILNNDNSPINWTSSLYANGTPGAAPETDLSISGTPLRFSSSRPLPGSRDTIHAVVKNAGINTVTFFKVKFFEDVNLNFIADNGEEVDSALSSGPLDRNDSALISGLTPPLTAGQHRYIAQFAAVVPADTVLFNNSITDSIHTSAAMDLAVYALQFSPVLPMAGSDVTVIAKIKNTGLTAATACTVRFFDDANANGLAEYLEFVDSAHFSGNLSAGDSTAMNVTVHTLSYRRHHYIAQLVPGSTSPLPDENPANDAQAGSVNVTVKPQSVVVNEINYHPASGASTEWIELFNRSSDTLDLKKWKIADESNFDSPKTISSNSYKMLPGEFVIIGKDSTLFTDKFPGVTATKFFLGSAMPTLNDGGDQVVIFDSLNAIVDSLFYSPSWGGEVDLSLERRDASSNSCDAANWSTCIASAGATPGKANSVTKLDFDLAITPSDIYFTPAHPAAGEPVVISAVIRNAGLQNIGTGISVKFYFDANEDSIGQSEELIDSSTVSGLAKGDSAVISISWTVPLSKRNLLGRTAFVSKLIGIEIAFAPDGRMENNRAFQQLKIGTKTQSAVISELLYNPDTTQIEFVEIYNRGPNILNLQNWKIADASTSKSITSGDHFFLPQTFRVLTPDSSFFIKFALVPESLVIVVPSMPNLNNDQDAVALLDDVGTIVDSVYYFNSWGGPHGKSLERIDANGYANDPANWTSCIASSKATPGALNSIRGTPGFRRQEVIVNEIMYSPFTGEPEYLELFNPSGAAINILNWSLEVGSSKAFLSSSDFSLGAGSYLVVAQSRSLSGRFHVPEQQILVPDNWLSLSNSGARIILRDLVGTVIDSVEYLPGWGGGEGISLEKKKADADGNAAASWGSCVFLEGGTPGKVNSLFSNSLKNKIKISAEPNPFFVDQGQPTKIILELPVVQARVTMKIYDNQGRLAYTLLNNSLSGSYREVIWDGKDRSGSIARMGIYIIYVEAIDEISGFSKSAKKTVVLGRKL